HILRAYSIRLGNIAYSVQIWPYNEDIPLYNFGNLTYKFSYKKDNCNIRDYIFLKVRRELLNDVWEL
ncbi:MAG: hypothetical protein WBP88_01020, partial [Nitrososphaeraceae archaeon]